MCGARAAVRFTRGACRQVHRREEAAGRQRRQSTATPAPTSGSTASAHFEVDPRDKLNAVIVNLDKARRNAKGMVEFSAPFVIIKPVDNARGNHKILYGINNRGNNIELPFQTLPRPGQQRRRRDAHDGLLFRLGYTFVDAGWAGDIITTETRLGATLPVAVQPDGRPIVAPIRIEYSGTGFTLPLKGNTQFRSYETADTDTAHSTLTVRDGVQGTRSEVPPTGGRSESVRKGPSR